MMRRRLSPTPRGGIYAICLLIVWLASSCGANVAQVIPTDRPTVTPTATLTPTRTPDPNFTPSLTPSPVPVSPTGGPSPTTLFGATSTAGVSTPLPTRVANPNAPRIEFFTSDSVAVAPGGSITLFWSTRGVNDAAIYRLDDSGARNQVWNVAPDGSLTVQTSRRDRGDVSFILSVGNEPFRTEQTLRIPLACLSPWFFVPAPDSCPDTEAQETRLIEEPFQRGRMLYVATSDNVYALFNDSSEPAWTAFQNRFQPGVDPELQANFVPPPGLVQPLRILGFVWRGNDQVRNRLGLATQPEFEYEGFIQTATVSGSENLYISSVDGSVLLLLPRGLAWQIITPS